MRKEAGGQELKSSRFRPRLPFLFAVLLALAAFAAPSALAQRTQITSARVWPSPDYTRVTLETQAVVKYSMQSVKDPERLVVDLEGVDITPSLTELADKISASDPYIKSVRFGRFKPGVTRVVFDLKGEVRPQAFALAPVGDYGHRLVLDLYPVVPNDPLIAFLDKIQAERAARAQEQAFPAAPDAPAAAAAPTRSTSRSRSRGS